MKRFFCCLGGEGSGTANQDIDHNSFADCTPSSSPQPGNCVASFPWQAIKDGTLEFEETLKLGGGNFDEVYWCNFPSIKKIGAVKILDPACHLEFTGEVSMLTEADHPNVIKLLGKCNELNHRAIIYEYMPNLSLDRYLTDPTPGQPQATLVLNWEARMKIAVGVAKGLAYVHTALKAVHRDVQAGNILINHDFEPKLAYFGLASKIVEDGGDEIEEESTVTIFKGTKGYMAPETRINGEVKVSTKSDVYSYGVLLLALFTGNKVFDSERTNETRYIADWFLSVYNPDDAKRGGVLLPDTALLKKHSVRGFYEVLDIAWMCVGEFPDMRTDMENVVNMILWAASFPIQESIASSSA